MTSAAEIVREDLDFIASSAAAELARLSGRRFMITGGAGFLGHYLVQAALHWNRLNPGTAPISVVVLDNFALGKPGWLDNLSSDPNLATFEHDVAKPLPSSLGNLDYIMHAASIGSPIYYRRHPVETMDATVNGLRAVLDHCEMQRKAGAAASGILYFSSSEIYGDPTPDAIPTSESYRGYVSCTGPRACYDESKRFGETLAVNFARHYGSPVKMVRPFNNYGPGMKLDDGRVVADFARNVINGDDIVMLSDGTARRTYCYSADAVVGYFKILVSGRPGEAYNIGIDRPEVSVLELAERIVALARNLFGYRGTVVRSTSSDKDYLVDNPNRRCPQLDKARNELGFTPRIELDDGLRRALLWYRENR